MVLSYEEIKNLYKERRKQVTISKAVNYQNRVSFHTETRVASSGDAMQKDFFAFVSGLLPKDKAAIFKSIFRYPVKTNEITSTCFDKLSRIFESKNPSFTYQFKTPENVSDWEKYRTDVLKEPSVWSTKAWEYFKTEFNCVMVVDLPMEQDTEKPEPYFYFLPICNVIDYMADPDSGEMEYIIFRNDSSVYVIDSEYYRVYRESDNELKELLFETPHGLGYTPASFFWNESLSLKEPDLKRSPISDELNSLDWFLYFHTAKKSLDVYAAYPIYYGYREECDYHDSEGNSCDNGFLRGKDGAYLVDGAGIPRKCPVCGENKMMGPGTYYDIPIPTKEQPDLHQPVGILTIDRASLDYNVEEEKRLKQNIIESIIGTNEQPTQKEAINEKQVKASFESQETILMRIKKGFEHAQSFIDSTICRLRYGDDFVSASINYGTEFYLYDVSELRDNYSKAKESGASEAELDSLQNKIIETQYRTNQSECRRMLMLAELEPYRHLSRDEVFRLHDKGVIDNETLRLKMNFSNYIRKFERENLNILDFGEGIPYERKIETIINTLKQYASEN